MIGVPLSVLQYLFWFLDIVRLKPDVRYFVCISVFSETWLS
jgi:hypothetical protein